MSDYNTIPLPVQAGRGRRINDLTNRTFGRLAVIGFAKLNKAAFWLCRCECGTLAEVVSADLTSDSKRSCGCLIRDSSKSRMTTHGKSYGTEYRAWSAMKRRCYNPKCEHYDCYGGRGISICKRWLESFENFIDDMGEKPDKSLMLERIDNNGNYEPLNCCWATPKEQSHNRRSSTTITSRGVTKVEAEWSRELGSDSNIVQKRLNLGWCVDCAVSLKPRSGKCPHKQFAQRKLRHGTMAAGAN